MPTKTAPKNMLESPPESPETPEIAPTPPSDSPPPPSDSASLSDSPPPPSGSASLSDSPPPPSGSASLSDSPPPPSGSASLYDVLEKALRATATDMALALGMEGETFTPPINTHLRGKIALASSGAASLGANALTRHDGQLEITVAATTGLGLGPAMAVAQGVLKRLPRGHTYPLPRGGQAVLRTGQVNPHGEQKDRSRALLVIPFYAFTKD